MPRLSTIAAFGFENLNPQVLLPLYKQLGCHTSQYYRNAPTTDTSPSHSDLVTAQSIATDAGLPFDSIHGLFGPQLDPASPDNALRTQTIQTYQAEAQIALDLHAPHVIIHPAAPTSNKKIDDNTPVQHRQTALQKSLEDLATLGQQMQVTFHIENLPRDYFLGDDPPLLAKYIRHINSTHLRMCFDTGHCLMTQGPNQLGPTMSQCLDVVSYVHLNDNDGQTDSHALPGQGHVPWQTLSDIFAQLENQTPVMLECFESPQTLTQQIQQGYSDQLHRWLALG